MKTIIIVNKKAGNGLISLPKVGDAKREIITNGSNELPLSFWEKARMHPQIRPLLENGTLVELAKKVEAPTEAQINKILSFSKFCLAIKSGKDGIIPEPGGHFVVELDEGTKELDKQVKSFRVKSNSKDVRAVAYAQYLENVGGKPNPKVTAKELKDMSASEIVSIVKDTFNAKTLKKWSESNNKDLSSQAQKQMDKIKNFNKED